MMYAEDSLHYWRNLVWNIGLKEGQLRKYSMGEIMSRTVERSDNASAHPLVKVYTEAGLRQLFDGFEDIEIVQRQMEAERPASAAAVPRRHLGRSWAGTSIIKARKPRSLMLARLSRLWRRSPDAAARSLNVVRAPPPTPTLEADVEAIGLSTIAWCRQPARSAASLYSSVPRRRRSAALQRARTSIGSHATIAAAERVIRHEFDLLGSGWYVPVDPDRPARGRLYADRLVPRSDAPAAVPARRSAQAVEPPRDASGNADIKYPWELARCQHWATLGQAFRLTGDERFATRDRPRARRLRRGQPDRCRRQLDLHDGCRHSRGQLGDRPRADAREHVPRRRVLARAYRRYSITASSSATISRTPTR